MCSLSAGRAHRDAHAPQHTARARWTAAVPATCAITVITTDGAAGRRAREVPPLRGSPRNRSSCSAPQPITPPNPPRKPLKRQRRDVQGGAPVSHAHFQYTEAAGERGTVWFEPRAKAKEQSWLAPGSATTCVTTNSRVQGAAGFAASQILKTVGGVTSPTQRRNGRRNPAACASETPSLLPRTKALARQPAFYHF